MFGIEENYCLGCKYANQCEDENQINFCDDCKDCDECTIKTVTCEAGHYIECNNGFESKYDDEDLGE